MKLLTLILATLIVLVQYPLWLGKGSWFRVWEVDQEIRAQREANRCLQDRNSARSELGMIKQDEIFFQVVENPPVTAPPASATSRAAGP